MEARRAGQRFFSRHAEIGATACLLAVCAAVFAGFLASGWPGAPNHCVLLGDCYCEAARPGPIAQPANTWSVLPRIAAALGLAWYSGRRRRRTERSSANITIPFYATLFCVALLFLAIGSALFHASLTNWGGVVDMLGMFLWIDFLLCYDLASIYQWSRRRFLLTYLVMTAVFVLPRLISGPIGVPIFAVVFAAWLLLQLAIVVPARVPGPRAAASIQRDPRWLWAALAAHVAGFAIWSGSHAGGLLCRPDSLWQGHAAWHLLNTLGAALLYPYLLSEKSNVAAGGTGEQGPNRLAHAASTAPNFASSRSAV